MMIIHEFGSMPYKSKAAEAVVSNARKVLTDAAILLMQQECSGLCTTCWGDGFHRTTEAMLSGPCRTCNGTGFRLPDTPADQKGEA